MKYKILLLSGIFWLLIAPFVKGQQFHSPDKSAIQKHIRLLETTWNTNGIHAYCDSIFADSNMTFIWGNTICHSAGSAYKMLIKNYRVKPEIKLRLESIKVNGNFSSALVYWEEIKTGKISRKKAVSMLYEKVSGNWQLIQVHIS